MLLNEEVGDLWAVVQIWMVTYFGMVSKPRMIFTFLNDSGGGESQKEQHSMTHENYMKVKFQHL